MSTEALIACAVMFVVGAFMTGMATLAASDFGESAWARGLQILGVVLMLPGFLRLYTLAAMG